jgi:hypothetical protein
MGRGCSSEWNGHSRNCTALREVLRAGGPAPCLEVELVLGEELVNRLVVLDVEERLVHCE